MSATACAGMRILIFLLTLAFAIGCLIFAAGAACMAASGILSLTGILLPLAAILAKVGVAALLGGGAIAFVFAVCVVFTLVTYFVAGCHQQPAVSANTGMAGFLGPMGGGGLPFPFPGLPFPLPGLPPGIDPAKFLQCLVAASAGCNCGGTSGGDGKNPFADAWNMLQGGIAFLDDKRREAEEKAAQLRSWIEQQAGQAGSGAAKTVEHARQQLSELEKQGQQFGEALNSARAAGGQMLSNAGKSPGLG